MNTTITEIETKTTRKRPQITVHMTREMLEEFKTTTDRLGQNQSAVLRMFIQSYLENNRDVSLNVSQIDETK